MIKIKKYFFIFNFYYDNQNFKKKVKLKNDKMNGTKTKYCIGCGKKIDRTTNKCPYCHTWQDNPDISRNHLLNTYVSPEHNSELNKIDRKGLENNISSINEENTANKNKIIYSDVLLIRRLLLLLIMGSGLYRIWWYYKTNSLLKNKLNQNIHPVLRTIGFLIPFVRWIMFYLLIHKYEKILYKEDIESYSSILNTFIFIFIPIIGPIWTICNIQESINFLWYKLEPDLPVRRKFTTGEKVFLIIIILIIMSLLALIIYILMLSLKVKIII